MRNIPKIDIVYTWVDDKDIVWAEKKKKFEQEYFRNNIKNNDAINNCRFINNDELKYSLRSLEKYAPWINHIYIVTDNQTPDWLNTNNPKITIVDHKEILPKGALPTFNSLAIEHCIINIPNLSEYFLYANDDQFFYKKIEPTFFFKNNKIIYRYHRKILKEHTSLHSKMVKYAHNLIYKKFKKKYNLYPFHGIDLYRKSEILDCYKIFKEEIDRTIYTKFRDKYCVSRVIYSDYSCIKKLGYFKKMTNYNTNLPFLKSIYNKLFKIRERDALTISNSNSINLYNYIKKYKPMLLCLNDDELATDNDRKIIKEFLEKTYNKKSQFEK